MTAHVTIPYGWNEIARRTIDSTTIEVTIQRRHPDLWRLAHFILAICCFPLLLINRKIPAVRWIKEAFTGVEQKTMQVARATLQPTWPTSAPSSETHLAQAPASHTPYAVPLQAPNHHVSQPLPTQASIHQQTQNPPTQPSALSEVAIPAAALSNQEIAQEDLITLKTVLKGAYTFGSGQQANFDNTLSVTLRDGKVYRAWYNSSIKCLNLQASDSFHTFSNTEKTGIGIQDDGTIVSVYKDGARQMEPLLGDRADLVKMYIEEALKVTSRYEANGRVMMVYAGLRKIPEFHLRNIARILTGSLHGQRLFVIYKEPNLQQSAGVDGGGLTRDYISSLLYGLTENEKSDRLLHFKKMESGEYLPTLQEGVWQLSEEQKTLLGALGTLFMYCYHSTDKRTGNFFDSRLFDAVLAFQASDLSQTDCSFQALLRAARSFYLNDPIYLQTLDALSAPDFSEDALSLLESLGLDADTFIDELFPGSDLQTKLQNNWQAATEHAFYHLGLANHLLPAFAIAQAMFHGCSQGFPTTTSPHRIRWEQIQREGSSVCCTKIQGNIDREGIIQSLEIDYPCNEEIHKKVGWLKEWIGDETTSNDDLRRLLKFISGSPTLPIGAKIRIQSQYVTPYLPAPQAHTCFFTLDFAPTSCEYGGLNDRTKLGFLQSLRYALTQADVFSMS